MFILEDFVYKNYFEKIKYNEPIRNTCPQVQEYIFPGNKKVKVQYYLPGNEHYGDDKKVIKYFDPRFQKVSALYTPYVKNDPNPRRIYTFCYDKIIQEKNDTGMTKVLDVYNNPTFYFYDDSYRPTVIKRCQGNGKNVLNKDLFVWGGKDTNREGFLLWKIYCDKEKPLKAQQNLYDNKGNVLKEVLYGNISGKENSDLKLNPDNSLQNTSLEKQTKTCSFTSNNNLSMQIDPNGLKTEYTYFLDTDLILTKTEIFNDKIIKKMTNTYDEDYILIKSVEDFYEMKLALELID